MNIQFTQEVKDNWVKALESGNFKQGYTHLETPIAPNEIAYCCLGVLGHITEGVTNQRDAKFNGKVCPYNFLIKAGIEVEEIWRLNDKFKPNVDDPNPLRPADYKDDYSNVLEHIKSLPVIETI